MNGCLRLFVLFLALVLPFFALAANTGDIIITEIMYDLDGADDGHEWVEIYNNNSQMIDLTDWRFNDGSNHIFNAPPEKGSQGSIIINPFAYAILADNAFNFLADHPGFSGTVIDTVMSLNNTGDTLKIIDNNSKEIDFVAYQNGWGAGGNGKTLEKINLLGDNSQSNWQESASIAGTPGYLNGFLSVSTPIPTPVLSSIITPSPTITLSSSPESQIQTESSVQSSAISTLTTSATPSPSLSPTISQLPSPSVLSPSNIDNQTTVQSNNEISLQSLLIENQEVNIPDIYINELLPNPKGDDKTNEWIEIYNNSSVPVDLSGFILEDASGKNFVFPSDKKIEPYSFLIVYGPETNISLNNNGDWIKLFLPQIKGKKLISEVRYEAVQEGYSVARNSEGNYIQTSIISPGAVNIIKEPDFKKDNLSVKIQNESEITVNKEKENNNSLENEKFLAKNPLINKNILFKPLFGGILILLAIIILSLAALFKSGAV